MINNIAAHTNKKIKNIVPVMFTKYIVFYFFVILPAIKSRLPLCSGAKKGVRF